MIAGERIPGYRIEGHAIVSDDERIAGPDGQTPLALSNEADWLRFQAALDGAAVVLIGRRSHEANPNQARRNRVVVSSSAAGIERRGADHPVLHQDQFERNVCHSASDHVAVDSGHAVLERQVLHRRGCDKLRRDQRVQQPNRPSEITASWWGSSSKRKRPGTVRRRAFS